jgi:hypothetical protein
MTYPKLLKLILTLCFLLIAGAASAAQISGSSVLIPSISKQSPAPGESVTINIQSYQADLDRATIRWTLNGELLQEGAAQKSVTFTIPVSGVAKVQVNVKQGGAIYTQNYVFLTGLVDLIWEADGYTPPFYRGRSLASPETPVRVMAIPELRDAAGKKVDPAILIYKWSLDGRYQPTISGPGRQTAVIRAAKVGSIDARVEVSNLASTIAASRSINIPITGGKLLFYQDRPLQGVWYESALTPRLSLSDPEFTVRAEPYYLSSAEMMAKDIKYEWLLGDKAIEPHPENQSLLTFQTNQNSSGVYNISIKASNLKHLLQFVQNTFTIEVKPPYAQF